MASVCVIGGGPAGSSFATRMATLGHDVTLVERSAFPRRHLGESLTPGVLKLLEATGARDAVEAAGFPRAHAVEVRWDEGERLREDPRAEGMLVDRGTFDALLLARARDAGVAVIQPATLSACRREARGWSVELRGATGAAAFRCDFLADARGRAGGARGARRRTAPRTLAVHGYWRGAPPGIRPRIEAGADAWFWRVPLPDGTCNILAFVDAMAFREAAPAGLEARFAALLARSRLMEGWDGARADGPVAAIDATPHLDDDPVQADAIRLGDAALAIDPISSSGVQKAIQGALAGAVVANTLLRRPGDGGAAIAFYRDMLAGASRRHARWTSGHYASVARGGFDAFWRARAAGAEDADEAPGAQGRALAPAEFGAARLVASPDLRIVEQPCLDADFVVARRAIAHPGLDGPVAYLGEQELAPLLDGLPAGLTAFELARAWQARLPPRAGLATAAWMVERGLLLREDEARGART
jgi:flavin-dependent dehydrogenase